ncbi:MAG: hypothetical protein JXD22_09665 [Sedimentisphaerales bacterium]|nr:hypothetical protein [Sedimentisphaerales bacterium]
MLNNNDNESPNKSEGNDKSFFTRMINGHYAARPGIATVVLALVLGLTLLAAQMLVSSRSVQVQAHQNASIIIGDVAARGLSDILTPDTRFYLLSCDNKTIGFSAVHFENGTSPSGQKIIIGKELSFRADNNELSNSEFVIADNLRWHNYKKNYSLTINNVPTNISIEYQFKDNLLRIARTSNNSTQSFPPLQITRENLVPMPLIDFFSSLAADVHGKEGTFFSFINPDFTLTQTEPVMDIWIQNGGKIPKNLQENYPDGTAVQVQFLQLDRRQIIYYDRDHYLIWQKDLPKPEQIHQAVTRDEILQQFPQAQTLLQNWPNDQVDI